MRRFLLVVSAVLVFAASATAQTASECASGTSTELQIFGGVGEVAAHARTYDPMVCAGRARVEVWLVGLADVCYQPVSGQGGVYYDGGLQSCVNEGTNGTGLGRWASAGVKHVSGMLNGWVRAESHHFYIHTDGSWSWPWVNGARAAETYITPQNSGNGNCDPWVDGDGDGIPGEDSDCGSPIVVPLTANGDIRLTGLEDGVLFDLNGDGIPERMGWTARGADVAFLAIDRNGNGRIDDGRELLGEFTLPGVGNGFIALDTLAGHVDAVLDDEPLFRRLLLWTDRNHNGRSEPRELQPASNVIRSISLGYLLGDKADAHGNLFKFTGWSEYLDGRFGGVPDVYFVADYGEDESTRQVTRERTRERWRARLQAMRASR